MLGGGPERETGGGATHRDHGGGQSQQVEHSRVEEVVGTGVGLGEHFGDMLLNISFTWWCLGGVVGWAGQSRIPSSPSKAATLVRAASTLACSSAWACGRGGGVAS